MIFPEKLNLANIPTKIIKLCKLSKIYGANIYLKRDDLTGFLTGGNKIRKLEFFFKDIIQKGCDTVITCGGIQSNHARATAVVARRLGIDPVLILRGDKTSHYSGNLLIDKILGAKVITIDHQEYKRIDSVLKECSIHLKADGKRPYIIPEGGSNGLGSFGYIHMMKELKKQMKEMSIEIDSIVHAVGSGGTSAGLVIGKKLYNIKADIYGINVCNDKEYFVKRIYKIIMEAKRKYSIDIDIKSKELNIIDGYKGLGYAISRDEEIELIIEIAREEGIIFDPVYTGKAILGMLDQLNVDKNRFGENILFIHTGGILGLLTKEKEGKFSQIINSMDNF